MSQEMWLVVAMGAGFLLLGIAASPLGWAAILSRRTRADRESEQRFRELHHRIGGLQQRLEQCEALVRERQGSASGSNGAAVGGLPPISRSLRTSALAGHRPGGRVVPSSAAAPAQPNLITVPRLAGSLERMGEGDGDGILHQRYAAIWEMADAGAPPDAIARATGQPIGQVELILGLRRQGALRRG